MSSLSAKDRVSLCSFTFSDGRRCRTPRVRNHPHFCPYHAQKEARARAAQSLGKDLDYFFSGDYLSACDLSTALGRLIPAVLRGDVKPRAARTVAYLAQTLLQAIHISQHEYCEAFSSDAWRKSIRNSVNHNYDYRFPPAPKPAPAPEPQKPESPQPPPQPAQTPVNCRSSLATHHSPLPQAPQPEIPNQSGPAPSPHTPMPPTSAEFVQHVVAGLQTGSLPASPHVQPAPPNPQPAETFQAPAASPNNSPPTRPFTPPKTTPLSPSAPLTPTGTTPPAPPQPYAQTPASQPVNPREPNRDAPWLDHTCRIRPDSKLL